MFTYIYIYVYIYIYIYIACGTRIQSNMLLAVVPLLLGSGQSNARIAGPACECYTIRGVLLHLLCVARYGRAPRCLSRSVMIQPGNRSSFTFTCFNVHDVLALPQKL